METTFRTALAISAVIHSVLFVPLYRITSNEVNKPVVVDYVRIKEPEVKVVAAPDRPLPKPAESAEVEIKKKVSLKEARELAKSQAPLRNKKDYINYYQLVREKIRQCLKERYGRSYGEGDVALIFILHSNGSLASVDVERASSVPDRILIQLAVLSIKEASPFPPFPKELALPKMSFDLMVSFKKQ